MFSLILRPPPSVILLAPSFHLSGTITFDNFFSPATQIQITIFKKKKKKLNLLMGRYRVRTKDCREGRETHTSRRPLHPDSYLIMSFLKINQIQNPDQNRTLCLFQLNRVVYQSLFLLCRPAKRQSTGSELSN